MYKLNVVLDIINNQYKDLKNDYFLIVNSCLRIIELINDILSVDIKDLDREERKNIKELNKLLKKFYKNLNSLNCEIE